MGMCVSREMAPQLHSLVYFFNSAGWYVLEFTAPHRGHDVGGRIYALVELAAVSIFP